MPNPALLTTLDEMIDRLARLEPAPGPFLSLFLDARPNEHGRDNARQMVGRELRSRRRTVPPEERDAYDADAARIEAFVRDELEPSANGAAVFACSASGVFETAQLVAPLGPTRLHVGRQPHLYPLMQAVDRYRTYAVVVADTQQARIYVFGLATTLDERQVQSEKMRNKQMGGWSQARYQRHDAHWQRQHVKEVVETLDRTVREDGIDSVILAGDEVVMPMLRAELPAALAAKVVDVLRLDIRTPEHEVLKATAEAFQRWDATSDADHVRRAMDEHAAGGLGVVGVRDTRRALQGGQVDELLLASDVRALRVEEEEGDGDLREVTADQLATMARQTDARVRFVEDASLLERAGGVAALLRFRI